MLIILCILVVILFDSYIYPERYEDLHIYNFRYHLSHTNINNVHIEDIEFVYHKIFQYNTLKVVTRRSEVYECYINGILHVAPDYDVENNSYCYVIPEVSENFVRKIHQRRICDGYINLYNGNVLLQ